MASDKKIRKDHPETVEAKKVRLPTLKPKDAWLDKYDRANDIPEKIKRLWYLPTIANATAVYAHENNLSHNQKDYLILLFRAEADKAFELIYEQVELTVGNSPSDRIGYLKDFESWQERLIELLRNALDRSMNKKTWNKRFEALSPDNEPLFDENRQEWVRRLGEHTRLKSSVFDEFAYWQKFSDFTKEAMKLIRQISTMLDITMERPEWMYKALKKVGKLPENIRSAKNKNDSSAREIAKTILGHLDKPIKELNAIVQNQNFEKKAKEPAKTKGEVGRPKVTEAEAKKRRRLKADWEQARDAKISKSDFCDDKGIGVEYLNNCVLRWCLDHPR